jgi:hypothetical protein
MNEELTTEVLEAIVNCDGECIGCPVQSVCDAVGIKRSLATALLAERAKPKVWDGAPEWVNAARVRFFVNDRNDGHSEVFSETYRRELPKTRARIIAEEVTALINRAIYGTSVKEIEAVLKRYAGELTNTKETN